MVENLLSKQEIELIEYTVFSNPALRNPNVISLGPNKTDIYKVSPINGLILIKGDKDTGFTHINERHNYWSQQHYWKENDRLDNPSKFGRRSIPIFDYTDIPDKLYCSENLNMSKNSNPELFEVYIGEVEDDKNGKLRYRMVLYAGTKIIHTLFPENSRHKEKHVIDYRRGKPKGVLKFKDGAVFTMAVPYYDVKNRVAYSFQIIRELDKNLETAFLFKYYPEKTNKFMFSRDYHQTNDINTEIEMLDRADLSQVEKLIKRIENDSKG